VIYRTTKTTTSLSNPKKQNMIDHTQSYKRIKQEQQKIWDFAVLICHAVPALKKTIAGVEESVPLDSIPTSDYFTNRERRLKAIAKHYNYNIV